MSYATVKRPVPGASMPPGAAADSIESARPCADRLYPSKHDLPVATRAQIVELLNQRLADCLDLQLQCKHAHWNVRGVAFYALHRLFDDAHEAIEGYADLIGERIAQLGGVAEGTVRVAAGRSTLLDYPQRLASGDEHVAALSDVLAQFARSVRIGIEELMELRDAAGADVLTEVARGTDKWLWFVEAHRSSAPERVDDGG